MPGIVETVGWLLSKRKSNVKCELLSRLCLSEPLSLPVLGGGAPNHLAEQRSGNTLLEDSDALQRNQTPFLCFRARAMAGNL